MCGISGIIAKNGASVSLIGSMNELIRHRGPDDEGYLIILADDCTPKLLAGKDTAQFECKNMARDSNQLLHEITKNNVALALGHRRLAIVDLSPLGHQPMATPDGLYWIVFNGEIYNHQSLRIQLTALGHSFRSQSDTEVILAAYAHWGIACLNRFHGMWAFAIYDVAQKQIILARDRFGIKPLYYWIAPDQTICFGSEIKQFTAFPNWDAKLNPQRAYDFLISGLTDHCDETMFAGVFQIPAGSRCNIDIDNPLTAIEGGRLKIHSWYFPNIAPFTGSFEEAASEFRRLFSKSIEEHVMADVPVGSCLSGGLDSSSIVCVVSRLLESISLNETQSTFSATSESSDSDETDWIKEVIRSTGVSAHFVQPAIDSLFHDLAKMTWHQDEPFGSTSIYAQRCVFGLAAASGVKVMLDGQGADEQLAGYHGFFSALLSELSRSLKFNKLNEQIELISVNHGMSAAGLRSAALKSLLPVWLRRLLRRVRPVGQFQSPPWLNIGKLGAKPITVAERWERDLLSVRRVSSMMISATSLPKLLHWEDRNSMSFSLEARVPFLDHHLVEFVLSLPSEFKIFDGVTKRVQRAGMSGIIPNRIRDRKDKIGFATAEELWLRYSASQNFRDHLQSAINDSQGILTLDSMKILDSMIEGQIPFSSLPWRMISFGAWMRCFSVKV